MPVAASPLTSVTPAIPASGAHAAMPTGSVLLVCQSDNTLSALAAILHQAKETALTAQTSKDAWDCIKTGTVACVVQDLTSLNSDAITLFRACRSSRQTASIPFLFLIKNDFLLPKLDILGGEVVRDAWLVLPCSAQQFLTSVRGLINSVAVSQGLGNNHATPAPAPLPSAATIAAAAPESKPSARARNEEEELLDVTSGGGVFAGRLGVLDVTKILSMIEPLRLTGSLKLCDGKRIGYVHFVEGGVRHCELNDIEGADALFLLFHLKTGTFRFDVEPPTPKQTIEGNTMALLLEGLRQMDEAKALVMAFKERRATGSGRLPKVN